MVNPNDISNILMYGTNAFGQSVRGGVKPVEDLAGKYDTFCFTKELMHSDSK